MYFYLAGSFISVVIKESAVSLDVARYVFGVDLDAVGYIGGGGGVLAPPCFFGIFSCVGASCCLGSGWEQRCFLFVCSLPLHNILPV